METEIVAKKKISNNEVKTTLVKKKIQKKPHIKKKLVATSTKNTVSKQAVKKKIAVEIVEKQMSAIVIDSQNKIVFTDNANKKIYPASLTKIMTIYILLNALKSKKITMNTKFKVSKLAYEQPPSKLGLEIGSKISVQNIIKALLVKSANDVAVVAAEGLAGSVDSFCVLMNKQAKKNSMPNTYFKNSSGLYNSKQTSSAADMAKLLFLIHKNFPEYWYLFSQKSLLYDKQQHNTHCKILRWYQGADGAKTGYINASGFNLTATAIRYNKKGQSKRLFVAVTGHNSSKERDIYAASLMDKYFGEYTISKQHKHTKHIKKIPEKQSKFNKKQRDSLQLYLQNVTKNIPQKSSASKKLSNDTIIFDEETKITSISHINQNYIDTLYEYEEELINC